MDEKRPKRQRRAPRKIDAVYLENAALYYLQRYATSSQNLKTVLTRKIRRGCAHHGQDPAAFMPLLDSLVDRYLQVGLLNDAVYAEGRAGALRRQGLSRQAIQQRLSQKGLPASEIAAAIQRIDDVRAQDTLAEIDHELVAARTLAKRKRIGPWRKKPLADPKAAQKEMAALARAGFSYDTARQALQTPDDMLADEDVDN